MNMKQYSKKALTTDYATYNDFHTGDASARLDYATIGLVTESAKILNIIKKTKKNLSPLDKKVVLEELGDLLWYLNLTIDELDLTFDDVMEENISKITKKYLSNGKNKLVRGK